MPSLDKNTLMHIQKHVGVFHYRSLITLAPFLDTAFNLDGNTDIKSCPTCLNCYALMLLYKEGVEQDIPKGLELLNKAGQSGLGKAMWNLGCFYERGDFVEQNINKAYNCYKQAVALGDDFAISKVQALKDFYPDIDTDNPDEITYL